MKRFLFWIRRKKRIREKKCGQFCLTCPYYLECSGEGDGRFIGLNIK